MIGKIIAAIGVILTIGTIFAVSWALTCGILYLIALCFNLVFSWKIATGIWLGLFLLNCFFGQGNKSKK